MGLHKKFHHSETLFHDVEMQIAALQNNFSTREI